MFDWMRFQLTYASALKLVGSMIKPLGMNINLEGLQLRVEEMEKTDMPGSMVFLTKEPKDVLKIIGLDRRILNTEFKTNEERKTSTPESQFSMKGPLLTEQYTSISLVPGSSIQPTSPSASNPRSLLCTSKVDPHPGYTLSPRGSHSTILATVSPIQTQ
jgi:hypothetical protein